MSASPVLLNPSSVAPSRPNSLRTNWMYVACSILFICCTSTTFMGGTHTGALLNAVWRALFGTWHYDLRGIVNLVLRKVGHFFGYGMIGLIFRNAWTASLRALTLVRSWISPFATSLAVASTFLVASLDEWHQRYVPGRVGSFHDVLIDTAGALMLNLLVWELRASKRRKMLNA